MRDPNPINDDLALDDVELWLEFRQHACLVATCDDSAEIAVRLCRMRDLLQEYLGKPIDHGDFRDLIRNTEVDELAGIDEAE